MNRTIEQAKNCICPVKIKDIKWCQGDGCMAWEYVGVLKKLGYCKIIKAMAKK